MRVIPWFIFIMVVSLIAGASSALMAASWLMPTFLSDTSVYIRNRAQQEIVPETMDPLFERQLEQRIVSLYDARKQAAATFYGYDAKVARVALLSSDGWGVMRYPGYQSGEEAYWQPVNSQGVKLSIERVVPDAKYGLVYVKFQDGDGFQVFSFFPWDQFVRHTPVWTYDGSSWQKTAIERVNSVSSQPASPLAMHTGFTPKERVSDGGFVVSEQGQLLGFAAPDAPLVPAFIFAYHLPQVIGKRAITYASLPVTGYIIETRITETSAVPLAGFYVSQVSSPTMRKVLQPGDVIVRIDERIVSAVQLPHTLLTTGEEITLDIWRNGTTQTVRVKKEIVP